MDGMPTVQMAEFQGRDVNWFGGQLGQRALKRRQVRLFGEDQQIEIAAKLRCAVKHARLAAHEQCSRATLPDRRKGFEYRAPDQAILRGRGTSPTTSWIRESVRRD